MSLLVIRYSLPCSVSNLSEDSYDYVFGGRRKTPPTTSTTQLKLTSPPVRLRPEGAYLINTLS